MKHSPGPWTAISTDRGVLIDSPPAMIAKVPFTGEQAEADGRLIAAAPDLLDACQQIVSAFDALEPANAARNEPLQINAARAAIAKATRSVK